jgi:hypothetical protein
MKYFVRAGSLAIVLATLIISTLAQTSPRLASTDSPQNNQCCECQGSSGPFKAQIPQGYGASVCSGTCAASGGQATGRVVACVTAQPNTSPNKIPFDNSLCFSKEGAAGNCKGNNWCTCGTAQVYLFDEAEHFVEPRRGTPQRLGGIFVLVNQKVKIRADIAGFGGSVSQTRNEIGPPKTTIRFSTSNGPGHGPVEEFPLPGFTLDSPPKPEFITHSWTTAGIYFIDVHARGYYHWSGDDGSCSYSCSSAQGCPGNNFLEIIVVDKPASPGKKYPTADPN